MELARIEIRAVEERFSKLILEKEEEVRKSRKIAQQNEDVQVYFPKLYLNNFFSTLGFSRFNWFIGQRLTVNLKFQTQSYFDLLGRSQIFFPSNYILKNFSGYKYW